MKMMELSHSLTLPSLCLCVRQAEAAKTVKMMELSHSLVLNEAALKQIPESKRPVFVFEWLRFLDKVLVAAQKVSGMGRTLQSQWDGMQS